MKRSLVFLVAGLSIATAPVGLHAQYRSTPAVTDRGVEHHFDYFVNQRLRMMNEGREALNGVGGRIMWSLTPGNAVASRRVALGGYVIHASSDGDSPDVWQYGTQADLMVSSAPVGGVVEPLVSLGVGAVQFGDPGRFPAAAAPHTAPGAHPDPAGTPKEAGRKTRLEIAPGIGARVRLLPGVNIRSDVRSVLEVGNRTRPDLEFAGGFSFSV